MLQDGCTETGVSVAFTVRAMDAGPILAQKIVSVDRAVQAPELLKHLFGLGTDLLLENLACVWSGQAAEKAQPQVRDCFWPHPFTIVATFVRIALHLSTASCSSESSLLLT